MLGVRHRRIHVRIDPADPTPVAGNQVVVSVGGCRRAPTQPSGIVDDVLDRITATTATFQPPTRGSDEDTL